MQLGEETAFEDTFSYACPKFVLAAAPAMGEGDLSLNYSLDAHEVQLSVFMREVRQQLPLPTVVSYLRLYQTIGLDKLARFRDADAATVRSQLLSLKHKTLQPETARDTASLMDGEARLSPRAGAVGTCTPPGRGRDGARGRVVVAVREGHGGLRVGGLAPRMPPRAAGLRRRRLNGQPYIKIMRQN